MNNKRRTTITLFCIALFFCSFVKGQYTVNNAHSHNDYKQPFPFVTAYNAGFGSIEADVYLCHDSLLVAHSEDELSPERSLENLYLRPLMKHIKENNGSPYQVKGKTLQLLIELKSSPDIELKAIDTLFKKYPLIRDNRLITILFTGRRPSDEAMASAPSYMYFDGAPEEQYNTTAEKRIKLYSDDFSLYTHWNGTGTITKDDFDKLETTVRKYHAKHKQFRFWGAPDNIATWKLMEKLGVDYISTDHINDLKNFLEEKL